MVDSEVEERRSQPFACLIGVQHVQRRESLVSPRAANAPTAAPVHARYRDSGAFGRDVGQAAEASPRTRRGQWKELSHNGFCRRRRHLFADALAQGATTEVVSRHVG